MTVGGFLIAMAALSIGLNLWQWLAGLCFRMRRETKRGEFHPAISVLKPLKGCDAETERCLESWFQQEYKGEWELLFGMASVSDPVCEIVQRLARRYPRVKAELIITDPPLGPNGKVSSLCYLSRRARHEQIVVSDADVFAERGFLSIIASELEDKTVGLVNCFYILANPQNLAMRLEAIAVNADFWTQVLQALTLRKMDFALGAVIATRRTVLERIGGFKQFVGLLADDYHLGKQIVSSGEKLVICSWPVECRTQEQGSQAVWRHQLRWSRTIKVCRPVGYFFSILGNATVWPLTALFWGAAFGRWLFVIALALRMLGAVLNYRKLTGQLRLWVALLAPLKDIAHAILWVVSFSGNVVTWSGERFRVKRGGKLTPLA